MGHGVDVDAGEVSRVLLILVVVTSWQSPFTVPVIEVLHAYGNFALQTSRQAELLHDGIVTVPSNIGSQPEPSQQ